MSLKSEIKEEIPIIHYISVKLLTFQWRNLSKISGINVASCEITVSVRFTFSAAKTFKHLHNCLTLDQHARENIAWCRCAQASHTRGRNTKLDFPQEEEQAFLLSMTVASRGMTMEWRGKHDGEEAGRNESMTYSNMQREGWEVLALK